MPENLFLRFSGQAQAAPPAQNLFLKHLPDPPPAGSPSPHNFGEPEPGGPPLPTLPQQEQPVFKDPGGVQADSYADGVTKWSQQGVFFSANDAANSKAIERYTGIVTTRILEEAGIAGPLGVSRSATYELTTALRNQVRGDLMYTWRSIEPEEMEGLHRHAAKTFLDRAIEVSDQQILQRRSEILAESKRARGAGVNAVLTAEESALLEGDNEIQTWSKTRGRLARLRSEVNRPEVINGTLRFISKTFHGGEIFRSQLSDPEQAQLGLVGEVFRIPDFLDKPEFEFIDLETSTWDEAVSPVVSNREMEVQGLLNNTLQVVGDATSTIRFVSDTVGGLVQDYRNGQRFGVSAEAASELPYLEILRRSNPELAKRVLEAKATAEVERELGQDHNITDTEFTREVRTKRALEGQRMVQDLLGADIGLPLTQKALRAPLDPQQDADSIFVTGQNSLAEAKQILSVVWRDGLDLARTLTDPVASKVAIGLGDGMGALARDASGEGPDPGNQLRQVLDPRNTPAVWARRLEKDATDGNLDPATIMGVLGQGDRLGSLGLLLSKNRLDAGESFILQRLRSGLTAPEIAAQWDNFVAQTLTGTKGQAALDALRNVEGSPFALLDKDLGSQKSRDAALADLALEVRKWKNHDLIPHDAGWTDFLSRPIGAATRWAVNTVVGEARDTLEMATDNPGDLTAMSAIFWGAGELAAPVIGSAGAAVLSRMERFGSATQRMAQLWKIQDDLGAVAVMNRPAGEKVLEHVKHLKGEAIPKQGRRLQILEDALDTVLQHQRADVDAQLNRQDFKVGRDVHQAARTVRAEIRKLPEGETLDLATSAGMTVRALDEITQKRYGLIPRLGQRLKRLTRMYGKENPQWSAVHADRIWTDLKQAIETGNLEGLRLEDFTGHLSARESWKLGHDGPREKINEIVRRAFGKETPPPEVNRYVNDLIQFFTDTKARFDTHRRLILDKHETADAFLSHLERSWQRRERRLQGTIDELNAIGRGPSQATAEALDRTKQNLGRLSRLRDRTRNIHFSEGVSYDAHPLLDEIQLDDIRAFAAATDAPDSRFWQRMRDADETEAEFWERLETLDEATGREARAEFKRQFAREYLNAPDINTALSVDDVTGRPVGKDLRARLEAERTAVRHEVARIDKLLTRRGRAKKPETLERIDAQIAEADARLTRLRELEPSTDDYFRFLEAHPEADARGWHTQELGDDWKKIEGWAAGEASEDLTQVFSRYQDMTDGNPDSALRGLRDFHFQSKIESAALRRRVNNLLEDYNTWDPKLQRAFDEAVELQVREGDHLPMADLRRRHPEAFHRLPRGRDETLDQMLTDSTAVRHNIVNELIRLRMIPEKDRDMWMAPYSGRASRHHASRKTIPTDDLPPTAGTLGLTGEEFSAKRHTSSFRLLVGRRNGVQEEYLFRKRGDAQKFIKRELGQKSKRRNSDGDLVGQTATGDSYHLLNPHTKESLKLHDFAEGGVGVFNGSMSLAEWIATARTALSVDRPGLSWTEAQFKQLDPNLRRSYTKIGDSEHRFGPLKGKWVHRDAMSLLDDAAGGARLMREWGDEVAHAANNHRRLLQSFMGVADRVGSSLLFRAPVQGLMTNLVFRNPGTWYANLLSNFAIFGPGAMIDNPFDYFFGTAARDAHALAQSIIYGKGRKKGESKAAFLQRLARENPLVQDVLRDNVLDDTLAFQALDTEGDKALREALFGDDPSGDRFARFARRGLKQFTDRETFQELLDDLNPYHASPALRGRMDRLKVLEDMEASKFEGLSMAEQEGAAGELADLRAFMRSQRGILSPFRKLADGAAWLTIGRSASGGRVGRFGDMELLSARAYGSIDNYARVRAYLINRFRGHSHKASLDSVNTFMQTYSQVPPAFQKLKRSALGSPIMAFPFEMLRIKANLVTHKPGFFMGQNHFLPVANALSIAASGADPDEVATEMRGRRGIKSYSDMVTGGLWAGGMYFGAEWANMNQNESRLFGIMSRLEVDDLPYGLGAVAKIVAPFVLGNPGSQAVLATATGRDMRTAGPLEGGIWEAAQKNAGRMMELFMPSLMPGAGKLANQISARQEAAAVDITKNGRSVLNAFASTFSGVQITGSPIERPETEEQRISFREGAEGQVVGKILNTIEKFGLFFAGEKTDQKTPAEFAIGEDDALRAIILAARDGTSGGDPGVWETYFDDDMRELQALKSRQRAGEKGLDADVKRATEGVAERMQVHNWMTGKKDLPANAHAVAARVRKAYDPTTMERIIQIAPLQARTFMLLRAAQHSQGLLDRVTPVIFGDLARRLKGTNARAIEESLSRINTELQFMGLDQDRVKVISEYRRRLNIYLPGRLQEERTERRRSLEAQQAWEAALQVTGGQ